MIQIPPDFSEFLKLLNDHEIAYLLVGGYAVGYHGYVRATGDMDIWIKKSSANAKRVVQALHDFGFRSDDVESEIFLTKNNIVRLGNPPLRIEIMNSISGVDFDECYEKRIQENWEGFPIHIINLEHLKINKKASGRYKDLSDLEHLK